MQGTLLHHSAPMYHVKFRVPTILTTPKIGGVPHHALERCIPKDKLQRGKLGQKVKHPGLVPSWGTLNTVRDCATASAVPTDNAQHRDIYTPHSNSSEEPVRRGPPAREAIRPYPISVGPKCVPRRPHIPKQLVRGPRAKKYQRLLSRQDPRDWLTQVQAIYPLLPVLLPITPHAGLNRESRMLRGCRRRKWLQAVASA